MLQQTLRRSWLPACLLCASSLLHAETFTVTRTDDPLPDACAPGDCSLREAMETADANDPFAGTDTIALPAGTITLLRGPLDEVHQPLLVQGAGSAQTRIVFPDANEHLFRVRPSGQLALAGLDLDASGEFATAIVVDEDASLSLDDVVVEEGYVSLIGSAEVRHSEFRRTLYCYGDVLIEDSAIFNLYVNASQSAPPPAVTLRRVEVDGTLYPDAPLASTMNIFAGTLRIEESSLSDTALKTLGAVDIDVRDSTITRSSVDVNVSGSTLALRRVHYVDNTGPVRSEAESQVTIEDSLFEDNTVRALYAAGGAEWNVSGSSFVGNRVDGNAGGAVVLEDDTVLRIRNSTFSGNSFTVDAAADGARGAAIGFRNGAGAHLILTHVTIVRPIAVPVGVVGSAIGGHGGSVAVDVSNTIVAGSCGMDANVLQNNAGNIESPGDSCGFDAGSQVAVSASALALGALGDHGGPTPTHEPDAASVAVDGGSGPQCLPLDQRGYPRPAGVRCDVGAVEIGAIDDVLFADGFE